MTTIDTRVRRAMDEYLQAGVRFDLDALIANYAPAFVNVRVEADGSTLHLTRDDLVQRLRELAAAGGRLGAVDDVRVLATTAYGPYASIILRRTKAGRDYVYNFVWDLTGGRPLLVREFTTALGLKPRRA